MNKDAKILVTKHTYHVSSRKKVSFVNVRMSEQQAEEILDKLELAVGLPAGKPKDALQLLMIELLNKLEEK